MSVLVQRLNDEYGAEVCVTAPTVPYKGKVASHTDYRIPDDGVDFRAIWYLVIYSDGREETISNPALFPDSHDATMKIAQVEEPIGPLSYFTQVRSDADVERISDLTVHATIIAPQGKLLRRVSVYLVRS